MEDMKNGRKILSISLREDLCNQFSEHVKSLGFLRARVLEALIREFLDMTDEEQQEWYARINHWKWEQDNEAYP